jgi:hypothetical protein
MAPVPNQFVGEWIPAKVCNPVRGVGAIQFKNAACGQGFVNPKQMA